MRGVRPAVRVTCTATVVVLALVLLRRTLAGIDTGATLHAVEAVGRWAPLALAPFLVTMAFDVTGARILLGTLGRSVPVGRMLMIRIATEALHLTAPAGFVVADSATAALLETWCGVPFEEGALLAVARKWLVTRAHATYIVFGALSGACVLTALSVHLFGARHAELLPCAVAASALAPLGLSLGIGAGFRGRSPLARLRTALARIPWRPVRSRMRRWQAGATRIDEHLARIGQARSATWRAAASFLGGWLFESVETCVLVRLVGGPLDLRYALAAEVGMSLVRSVGNVAPAGLGVQDAGYAMVFQAMGLPGPTTAAFVVLKRAKEVAWISAGYALLAALRRPVISVAGVALGEAFGPDRASARLVRRVA